jgi:hypothetical protein
MKLLPQKVPYFRRAAIMTSGPAPSPRSSSVEMTTVNSFDLPEAQDATRWHPESDWLVDLDKHPGLGMPDTDNRRPLTELESSNAQPLRDRRQCSGFFDRSAITGVESVPGVARAIHHDLDGHGELRLVNVARSYAVRTVIRKRYDTPTDHFSENACDFPRRGKLILSRECAFWLTDGYCRTPSSVDMPQC